MENIIRRVLTPKFVVEILDKRSKEVTLTHGVRGGSQYCRGHGRRTLMYKNRVTECILYSAPSWKCPQMLHSRKQDLASKREETVATQTGLLCV